MTTLKHPVEFRASKGTLPILPHPVIHPVEFVDRQKFHPEKRYGQQRKDLDEDEYQRIMDCYELHRTPDDWAYQTMEPGEASTAKSKVWERISQWCYKLPRTERKGAVKDRIDRLKATWQRAKELGFEAGPDTGRVRICADMFDLSGWFSYDTELAAKFAPKDWQEIKDQIAYVVEQNCE
ncbi:MAG: hypothetical protein QGG54_02080 [Gammaproteobacteria bacterium]|jgi:hypothetical protein|nr:hypothetical protein [Gammaproteobacteria bacterium]MDP6652842.1 hypothetical protein [Gammaproteobacteria bacterium]|tara:strand:+ start:1349 stop:1888 length:540 start_codon:yes stop_codon:yes gene_type:complete